MFLKQVSQSRGTGRISLSDFKDLMCSLKHWQGVFRSHAREKMGVLRAERLRDALKDIGFILPERALSLLVLRYMRKDGMLRFGDFVSAVLHLQRAFSKCGRDLRNILCIVYIIFKTFEISHDTLLIIYERVLI